MRSRPAVGTAVVALVLAACATPTADDDPDPGDAVAVDGPTVELTDADGWTWTVELAGVSTDPDLGAEPAPPGQTYVDVEVAITNELTDRRADLPGVTEVYAFVDDRGAVATCMTAQQEPMSKKDSLDGCLVAWDGGWANFAPREQDRILRDFETRLPVDPPREIAGGERARFSLRGLNAVDEAQADDVTVVIDWANHEDMMTADVTGGATIERGRDYNWVVLSAP